MDSTKKNAPAPARGSSDGSAVDFNGLLNEHWYKMNHVIPSDYQYYFDGMRNRRRKPGVCQTCGRCHSCGHVHSAPWQNPQYDEWIEYTTGTYSGTSYTPPDWHR